MISIESIGIALNTGIIPPVTKLNSKISTIGILTDSGNIPPKNFFQGKISLIGIAGEKAENNKLFYQVN